MGLLDRLYQKKIEKQISAYQNDLLNRHYEEVQNVYQTMRGWRHDYHNHIQTMKALVSSIRNGDNTEEYLRQLEDYLSELNQDLTTVDTVIKTGNVMVDAILNSKLSLIRSKNIPLHVKAVVPQKLQITDTDLCTLIGNLLDNAMEACLEGNQETPFIRIYIGILKEQFYLSVTNSTSAKKNSGNHYHSTKKASGHGFGLHHIDHIVEHYDGYLNRKSEDGVFATEILLPL